MSELKYEYPRILGMVNIFKLKIKNMTRIIEGDRKKCTKLGTYRLGFFREFSISFPPKLVKKLCLYISPKMYAPHLNLNLSVVRTFYTIKIKAPPPLHSFFIKITMFKSTSKSALWINPSIVLPSANCGTHTCFFFDDV